MVVVAGVPVLAVTMTTVVIKVLVAGTLSDIALVLDLTDRPAVVLVLAHDQVNSHTPGGYSSASVNQRGGLVVDREVHR